MMIVIVMEMHDAFLLIRLKQHHSTLPGQTINLSNL